MRGLKITNEGGICMQQRYECENCGHQVTIEASAPVPDCCGQPMKALPLEACREAGPEAARPTKPEEPCEDFRGNHQ